MRVSFPDLLNHPGTVFRLGGITNPISNIFQVSFAAGSRTATMTLTPTRKNSGALRVTVAPYSRIDGAPQDELYRVGSPSEATVTIANPLDIRFGVSEQTVEENGGRFSVTMEARTAPGAPRPRTQFIVTDIIVSSGPGAASKPQDYSRTSQVVLPSMWGANFSPSDFVAEDGVFVARKEGSVVSIVDDDIAEGPEYIEISVFGRIVGSFFANPGTSFRWVYPDDTPCEVVAIGLCRALVTIVDDDAAPEITTPSRIVVPEGTTTVATLAAEDADTAQEQLVWSITGGADSTKFMLTSAGALSFVTPKDSEEPDDSDGDGNYEVTVQVRDQLRRLEGNRDQADLVVALEGADTFAPVLERATVDGATLVLTWNELLDEDSDPGTTTFAVTAGNSSREVVDVSVDERTVTLTLDAEPNASDTITVSYTVPSSEDVARIKDAAGNAAAGFTGQAVTTTTNPDVNSVPTGLPRIIGKPWVNATLKALTSDIRDADGLSNPRLTWQWIANDGTSDTDIPGATWPSYTQVAADVGKTIKLRVTFTDDAGTEETLTSAPTPPVGEKPVISIRVDSTSNGRAMVEGYYPSFILTRLRNVGGRVEVRLAIEESGTMLRRPLGGNHRISGRRNRGRASVVTFEDGESEARLEFYTENDATYEPDSVVTVRIEPDPEYRVDSANQASVTIWDDDGLAHDLGVLWSAFMRVDDLGSGSVGGTGSGPVTNEKRGDFYRIRGSADLLVNRLEYSRSARTVQLSLSTGPGRLEGLTLHLGNRALTFPDEGDRANFTWMRSIWIGRRTTGCRFA